MKFKIGDKIRIKTWEQLSKEFEYDKKYEQIRCSISFTKNMNKSLPKDRIVVIKGYTLENNYKVKENNWYWSEDMMEAIDLPEVETIKVITDNRTFTRFDLLDFQK